MIYRLSNIMRSNDNGHDDDEDDPGVSTSWHVVWAVLWARLPAAMIGYKSMWALLIIMIIVIIITEQQERVPPAPSGEGGPREAFNKSMVKIREEAEDEGRQIIHFNNTLVFTLTLSKSDRVTHKKAP